MPTTPILLARQNPAGIMQTAGEVKNAFSSWDGCMAKGYCKWPVIVGIIIGALIAFSILWCFVRCLCCGKDLACCCFKCCSCCQPSRSHRNHKHLDSVPPTPYNQQYRSHGAPVYAGPGAFSQTATFESSTKVHEDSLPQMPSWETAASRKVEVLEQPEAHEMDRLKDNTSPSVGSMSPPARPLPMRTGSGPSVLSGPPSPHAYAAGRSPYGQAAGFDSRMENYGSRPDLGVRTGSRTGLNNERYGNTPYSGGAAYSGNPTAGGYGNSGGAGYRDNYGGGGGAPRSPGYAPAGSSAFDFGVNDNCYDNRYDNRSPVNSRPTGGAGNGGYATYNGSNSPLGGPPSNQYARGGTSSPNPYARGGTSSPAPPYGAAYSTNASNYQGSGPARKPAPGSWRDI